MTALSIHFGLNRVDPGHYDGWDGELRACEQDARDMRAIADANGFTSTLVLTTEATANRLVQELHKAARALKSGDTLLVSYSGHGGQIPDVVGDEADGKDETWVLYDRMVTDDELWDAWAQFAPGVRIVMVSDSCHSGTVARHVVAGASPALRAAVLEAVGMEGFEVPRSIPWDLSEAVYRLHRPRYESIQRNVPRAEDATVRATVLLLSGCQDNQLSYDGPVNGAFTAQLLKVWNRGAFDRDYRAFHQRISAGLPDYQSPNYYVVGAPNPAFEREVPFKPARAMPGIGHPAPCPAPSL